MSGFCIAGLPEELPWDSSLGKCALGFGTYVAPDQRMIGLSSELRNYALSELARVGFNKVLGSISISNEAGLESAASAGFIVTQYSGYCATSGGETE